MSPRPARFGEPPQLRSVFEFCSGVTLDKLLSQSLTDFHDGIKLIKCIALALRY
ncbi:hypothetical protein RSAG8_10958, partial [Rhizoctonia solani AG-8 WAC10335]